MLTGNNQAKESKEAPNKTRLFDAMISFHPGFFLTILPYWSPADIMMLLVALSHHSERLIGPLSVQLSIEWQYYNFYASGVETTEFPESNNLRYQAVRDYYILQTFSRLLLARHNSDPDAVEIPSLFKHLYFPQLMFESKHVLAGSYQKTIWSDVLNSVSQFHQKNQVRDIKALHEKLKQLQTSPIQESEVKEQSEYLHQLVERETVVVVTYKEKSLNLNKETEFKNIFTRKQRGNSGNEDPQLLISYAKERLSVSAYLYGMAKESDLLPFLLNGSAQPSCGSLQFLGRIEPITRYGNSFFILNSSMKQNCTAMFGSSLRRINADVPDSYRPVRLNNPPTPLINQFSDTLISSCLSKNFENYNFQYQEDDTEFVEVHIPSIIKMDDKESVRHVHYHFAGKVLNKKTITRYIQNGIGVTTGKNPFLDKDFLQAFQADQMEAFLLKKVIGYIYDCALFIAETTPEYLQMTADKDSLKFKFHVTYNKPYFHQAQAAGLLFQLGVRKLFKEKKLRPIAFQYTDLEYTIPLTGVSRQEGDVHDHDAYTYDHRSLVELLNKLIKKIIVVATTSWINNTLLDNGEVISQIGKGATEESNLTRDVVIQFSEADGFIIQSQWLYDSIYLEIPHSDIYHDAIIQGTILLGVKISPDNFRQASIGLFLIDMPLSKLLDKLRETYRPYQATVLVDDLSVRTYGDVLMALRFGFATPGGHNNDPYHPSGALHDPEFGTLDYKVVKDFPHYLSSLKLGETQNPSTIYYKLYTSFLKNIKEDTDEFEEGSLNYFPLYQLGNLSIELRQKVADSMSIPVEEFIDLFGSALPLRPVPSIRVYVEYYEKWLSTQLNLMLNIAADSSDRLTVEINKEYRTKEYRRKTYWLPECKFGEMTVRGNLSLLGELLPYFNYFRYEMETVLNQDSFVIKKMNPFTLQTLLVSFTLHNPLMDAVEFGLNLLVTSENHILFHFRDRDIVRVLRVARSGSNRYISLRASLGENGYDYMRRFLLALDRLSQVDDSIEDESNRMELDQQITEDIRLYKVTINELMHTRWGKEKRTLLENAVLSRDYAAFQILLGNPTINSMARMARREKVGIHQYLFYEFYKRRNVIERDDIEFMIRSIDESDALRFLINGFLYLALVKQESRMPHHASTLGNALNKLFGLKLCGRSNRRDETLIKENSREQRGYQLLIDSFLKNISSMENAAKRAVFLNKVVPNRSDAVSTLFISRVSAHVKEQKSEDPLCEKFVDDYFKPTKFKDQIAGMFRKSPAGDSLGAGVQNGLTLFTPPLPSEVTQQALVDTTSIHLTK